MTIHVRQAVASDLDAIISIYNSEVRNGLSTFDTVEKTVADAPLWFYPKNERFFTLVAVDVADVVVGWARLSPWSPRPGYFRTGEDSVYVAESSRGHGVGSMLLTSLLREATARQFRTVIARINAGISGQASWALHRSYGFQEVGILRSVGEKFGELVDTRVMQWFADVQASSH